MKGCDNSDSDGLEARRVLKRTKLPGLGVDALEGDDADDIVDFYKNLKLLQSMVNHTALAFRQVRRGEV